MKKKVIIIAFIAVGALFDLNCYAQQWISLNGNTLPSSPICQIVKTGKDFVDIHIQISGFYKQDTTIDGVIFQKLYLDEFYSTQDIGLPEMPVLNKLIYKPNANAVTATLYNCVQDTLDKYNIYPYQQLINDSASINIFEIDTNFYKQNIYYPNSNFVENNSALFRTLNVSSISFQPFKFNPYTNNLVVAKNFYIRIDFGAEFGDTVKYFSRDFEEIFKNTILNYDENIPKQLPNENDYNLLIITDNQFVNILNPLVRWKHQKGYKTKVVSTQTTGNTAVSIKDYIENEYNMFNIEYVLLVGDANYIPQINSTWGIPSNCADNWFDLYEHSYYSDFGYTDFQEDYLPEVLIGRFSVQTITQLNNMISKTINYEKDPPLHDWLKKCLLIAHKQDAPNKYQKCSEDIRNGTYSNPFLTFDKAYGASTIVGGTNAVNQTIINAINNGRGIVNYRGHSGDQNVWHKNWSHEGVAFGSTQINSLNNEDETPIIFSISCSNGWIHNYTGLGELFTLRSNAAVAFYGSTRSVKTIVNDKLNKEVFKTLLTNSAVKSLANVTATAQINQLTHFNYNCNSKWVTRCFLWLGDPTMEIWSDIPDNNLTISCDKSLCVTNESTDFLVTVNNLHYGDQAVITMFKDGELFLKKHVTGNASHQASVEFENVLVQIAGGIEITVSSRNYLPKVLTIPVENWVFSCDEFFPHPLIIDDYEEWLSEKQINRNIIIKNYGVLHINHNVLLHENARITVKNGGTLQIFTNAELKKGCTGYWSGITIEEGGSLFLSGKIKQFDNVKICHNGSMNFAMGYQIELSGNDSYLNIEGNLNINGNTTFTFTGNGYIKFSNPGPDYTYNITAGAGASMLFSGNGQSDKVLEIQQNTVRFPNLTSLTFENCKIEMGYEKRMQADYSYPVTFNNVKVTSTTGAHNNHRSFLFIGQSNVTINNSIFEYGYYGIYGNLTWTDGAALFITNSTFRYNTQGINIYGKGLNLTNCNVVNNTNYGIYCNGMSFTSDFTDCTISNNGNGIYYFGSNGAHINMEDTYIQSNNVDGLITSGAFDVNMLCVDINANRYGIRTSNGTFIKPYTCDFSNNYNTIFLNYGYVSLYKKYNQLQAMNDNYTLYGRTPVIRPIRAEHNRWESNQNATPVYLDNYYLRTYQGNKPPMPVEVWDSNPLSIACHFLPPILIRTSSEHILEETTNNNLPTVTISEQTMPLDEAVSYLQQQSKNINSETAFLTIIEEYSNLISSCNTWTDSNNYSEIKLYMSIAYGDLHSIISDFYTFVNHDKANQSFINGIEKIILLNENLVTNSNLSYTDYYEYSLDIPLLYRIIGNYDDAISYLENLLYDFSDEQNKSEMEHIQTWLCKINAEKAATEGLLNIDEFFIAIEDCENCYSTKKSQQNIIGHNDEEVEVYDDSFNNKELSIENSFEIIPNPNQGNFKIKLLTSSNNCEIRIINSVGQTVKRLTSIKERLNEINITGLKTGYYKVVYIQDNEIIDTQTVIVK